jgi:signal peptidase I
MAPTIKAGDHFASVGIKNNDIDPIERFDIVVFKPPVNKARGIDENTRYVFRVIGLAGETVELKKGVVFINDNPLDESRFEKIASDDDFSRVKIPDGSYFLLGDNRPDSEDSRFMKSVRREDIDGKVNTIIRKEDYDKGKRW